MEAAGSNPRPQEPATDSQAGSDSASSGESDNAPNDSHERPRLDDDPRSERGRREQLRRRLREQECRCYEWELQKRGVWHLHVVLGMERC
jgi:hypothetical protein